MSVAATPVVTTVTHEGGLRLVAEVRGHRVETDQPFSAGGTDSAPMPLEFIGAALGTCVALAIVQFCKTRGIGADGLTVAVTQHTAKAPYRVDRYDVGVTLPAAFPAEYREAIARVARTCAAYNTLRNTPEIEISLSSTNGSPLLPAAEIHARSGESAAAGSAWSAEPG